MQLAAGSPRSLGTWNMACPIPSLLTSQDAHDALGMARGTWPLAAENASIRAELHVTGGRLMLNTQPKSQCFMAGTGAITAPAAAQMCFVSFQALPRTWRQTLVGPSASSCHLNAARHEKHSQSTTGMHAEVLENLNLLQLVMCRQCPASGQDAPWLPHSISSPARHSSILSGKVIPGTDRALRLDTAANDM